MHAIMSRLKEPSTYAGLAPLLAGFGLFGFDEGAWQSVFVAAAAIAGVVAMIVGEKGADNSAE
tara:strand:+ start:1876 stop:2064 length:189 start_codon:yes stop_codon:yes gene_type:complete